MSTKPGAAQIAFLGDRDGIAEAKRLLIEELRRNGRLISGGLNMEPFNALRDVIRSGRFPSIGGPPQVVKIYEHMNAVPLGVYWPNVASGKVAVLGRPLMDYEKVDWRILDPDDPERMPRLNKRGRGMH